MIMNNRERFKRILMFIAALIIVFVFSESYSFVWNNYYNSDMLDPFWHNGNILMVMIYAIVYIAFTKSFSGFRIGYFRWSGLLGSQVLSILSANVIAYVQISLIGRGRLSVLPMVAFTAAEIIFAAIWSIIFSLYFQENLSAEKNDYCLRQCERS